LFAIDDTIETSVNTYASVMGISTKDKYLIKSLRENKKHGAKRLLLKMFPNTHWSFDGLKALIKKWTTQVLCGQCQVDHYPIRRTTVSVLSIFDQRFQSNKTPVFVTKHFQQLLCSIFLIFSQHFIKYLYSVLNPIIDVYVLTDDTITSSVAKNM